MRTTKADLEAEILDLIRLRVDKDERILNLSVQCDGEASLRRAAEQNVTYFKDLLASVEKERDARPLRADVLQDVKRIVGVGLSDELRPTLEEARSVREVEVIARTIKFVGDVIAAAREVQESAERQRARDEVEIAAAREAAAKRDAAELAAAAQMSSARAPEIRDVGGIGVARAPAAPVTPQRYRLFLTKVGINKIGW